MVLDTREAESTESEETVSPPNIPAELPRRIWLKGTEYVRVDLKHLAMPIEPQSDDMILAPTRGGPSEEGDGHGD